MAERPIAGLRKRIVRRRRAAIVVFALVGVTALFVDVWMAMGLYQTAPEGDAKIYSRMAVNIVDHGVFSTEDQPDAAGQFKPSIIRLPGYPLFLAAIYSVAGDENYPAVRAVQGVLHFAAAILAGMLAFGWAGGSRQRRRIAAFWTFLLAAFCPFTINYASVLLTEVVTIFLMVAMMLTATYAIKTANLLRSILWWALTGLIAGAVVEVRPDSGLFALAVGLTLIVAAFARSGLRQAWLPMIEKGMALVVAFILVLTPWTIRNEQVFTMFQPLAPQHAEMPGEFVPLGYYHWLRTWIDDAKYISPMLWELEIHRIDPNKIPASAFSNDDEKARVFALFDQYNNSDPDHPLVPKKQQADSDDTDDNDDSADSDSSADSADSDGQASSDDTDDQNDDSTSDDQELNLKISPESDAVFEQIARERIASDRTRYYFILPAERAATMWFDTHSDFYPFAGVIFPVKDIDASVHQDIWLPLFAAGVWIYTLLALAGIVLLLLGRWRFALIWLLMALLIAGPRVAYFATLENPEPRYLIELFFIAAVLGGIAKSRIRFIFTPGRFGFSIEYRRRNKRKLP
ncbi:MAG TPA: phospholipid carrier-dependent glycosyltransferase [Pyrinomonadaceae bacterium]